MPFGICLSSYPISRMPVTLCRSPLLNTSRKIPLAHWLAVLITALRISILQLWHTVNMKQNRFGKVIQWLILSTLMDILL